MVINPRLGVLIRTGNTADTETCAALFDAVLVTGVDALPTGRRAILDLDLVDADAAVEIGMRFRMRGVELVVAARPGTEIPEALQRNLTGGARA